MVALSQSPSPFATLLRRSKFATYDPRIGQVFTAYGGDAHRGNWGFKRPIGVRRRGAYVTVKSVDTPAQQTEWNSGEGQAKWIQKWEELNYEAGLVSGQRWRSIAGPAVSRECIDSEFAPAEIGDGEGFKERWRPQAVRNIHAMSVKDFEAYLEKLREKRPAFIEFLRKKNEKLANQSLFKLAQRPRDYHIDFIVDEASKAAKSMDSRVIDPMPHKTGGALYSHPSPLQTFLTTKPQPGRILADAKRYPRQLETYITAFAGMTPTVYKKHASGVEKMTWTNPNGSDRTVTQFRIEFAQFKTVPRTVGKSRQGIKGIKQRMALRGVGPEPEFGRSNSYMPGSLAYVAAIPSPRGKKGDPVVPLDLASTNKVTRAPKWFPENTRSTIGLLKDLISNQGKNRTDPLHDDDLR